MQGHFLNRNLTGIALNDLPLSKQLTGRQRRPATEQIVHGAGAKAISFPPIETMGTSCEEMLSGMNLSCARS